MSKESDAFEHRIHRIHALIDGTDSEVTWNDRIPDPDNPKRSRQIDITIKRGATLTLVECRIHNEPQDVKWVEELIGRRASLKAASVIGVSASGFTEGAVLKAKAHGIVLTDLEELTPAEVEQWGALVALTMYYYEFSDLSLDLLLSLRDKGLWNVWSVFPRNLSIVFHVFFYFLGIVREVAGETWLAVPGIIEGVWSAEPNDVIPEQRLQMVGSKSLPVVETGSRLSLYKLETDHRNICPCGFRQGGASSCRTAGTQSAARICFRNLSSTSSLHRAERENQTTSVDDFFRGRPPLRPLARELFRFAREVA
jgi:hypothetical protein